MSDEFLNVVASDKSQVFGFVELKKVSKKMQTTKVSVYLLDKLMKLLKTLDTEDVYISVTEDEVLFFRQNKKDSLALALANKLDN